MDAPKTTVDWRVLSAALCLSFVFGSIHAFAVLLPVLEKQIQTGRASISLAYSLAIVSLTGGVYLYPKIRTFGSAGQISLVVGCLATIGLIFPSISLSLASLYLGYGLLFGFSNGVVYMLFLDQARVSLKPKEGFAVGLATAFYGLGSAGYAFVLAISLKWVSLPNTWAILASSVFLAGVAGFFAMDNEKQRAQIPQAESQISPFYPKGLMIKLWAIYFLSACGGLMVIVHSAEIVFSHSPDNPEYIYAPSINALGNILGCLVGGWLSDRVSVKKVLALPQILALTSGILLLMNLSTGTDLTVIALIGLCYGALISIVPTAVHRLVGENLSADVFKRVFTAWGAAGLLGPSFAGLMFDQTGGYAVAIIVSCVFATGSLGLIFFLDRASATRGR